MANPGFQEYMLPILNYLKDKKSEVNRKVIFEDIADRLGLSDENRKELLQSGDYVYANRIGWALTYLKKAGLLDTPKRSFWTITLLGLKVIDENPNKIDSNYLKKFDSFQEFQQNTSSRVNSATGTEEVENETPSENLLKVFKFIKKSVCDELLTKVLEQTPDFFEKLVVDLLVKMGYGGSRSDAGKCLGKSGDGGIDGIIKEDKLGLDNIYLQAKRWKSENTVGRPEIQKFIGALSGQNARKGIFLTTSSFSSEAISYKPKNDLSLILIDGKQLVDLMYEYNVGVSEDYKIELKKVDNDFFE